MLKGLKKFKKKHKGAHRLLVFTCVAAMSWATWRLLDVLLPKSPPIFIAALTLIVGVIILALDDLHLKELD